MGRARRSWAAIPRVGLSPLGVLMLSLLGTLLLGVAYDRVTRGRDHFRLQVAVQGTEDRIRARIDTYVALLLATRGFVTASDTIDPPAFRRFVEQLELRHRYPGVLGIGFSQRFPWAERERFEAGIRAAGVPAFRVWPDAPRRDGSAVVLIEPLDPRNRLSLGYDMATEGVRREAMDRARDSGEPAACGPTLLDHAPGDEPNVGFTLYVPVYDGVPRTLEERRARLRGFVHGPLRVSDVLASLFANEPDPRVAFALRDEVGGRTIEMYRSPGFTGGEIATTSRLDVGGRQWTLAYETLPAFDVGSGAWVTPYVFAIGVALSGVFTGLALRQRQAERQLRLHSRILTSMSEGVCVTDESGTILYTNPAQERMFGYGRGELVGRAAADLFGCSFEAGRHELERLRREVTDKGHWTGEFENRRKDGSRFVTAVRMSRLEVAGERCWVSVQEDITARKRAEQERDELLARETSSRAAAEQANRVKDEFLAMLGHELRNPLAPIVTALELMRRRGRTNDPGFAVIERQVRYLRRLVDDLLDVSRITRGRVTLDRRRLALAAVVEDAIEQVQPLLEQRHDTLQVDVPPDLVVDGDRARLAQVVTNLLGNAAKYSDPGGRIDVVAERRGEEVSLRVRDRGMGIPADLLPRVFDLFTQGPRATDRSEGGLGIGLAVARGLVELHGGRIVARSEGPGSGSEFEVILPLASGPPQAESGQRPVDARNGPSLRVLVVDDNLDAAHTLAGLLAEAGHEVEVAYDAPQALETCARVRFDVAILDIGLPTMDGWTLAERLPEPKPLLYAITGYGREPDRARSRALGFARHFAKPAEASRLLAALAEDAREKLGAA